VEKHGRAGQATVDIIRSTRFAFFLTNATDTHSEYALHFFHCDNGCTKVTQCYITRTVPVLLFTSRYPACFDLHILFRDATITH